MKARFGCSVVGVYGWNVDARELNGKQVRWFISKACAAPATVSSCKHCVYKLCHVPLDALHLGRRYNRISKKAYAL